MDCIEEQSEIVDVFQINILIPLIKMVEIYMDKPGELSPDEFCILLFAKEDNKQKSKDACPCTTSLGDVEISPVSLQNVIVELFMNIARYEAILKVVSEDFLSEKHSSANKNLFETMVLVYVLIYRKFALSFAESMDCFNHFKIPRILSLISYLLRAETLELFYKTGCTIFEETFVERQLILPYLEANPRLEELCGWLREEKRKMAGDKKKVTVPVLMNVLNRPKRLPKVPPPTPEDLTSWKIAREIPETTYNKPNTEEKLASLRAKNKLQAMELLNDANRNAPSCLQRCKTSGKLIKDKQERVAIKIIKPVPVFKPVAVKHNAASILRECARIASHETKEVEKLKTLAEGGLDPSSILKLEEDKRQQEKEEELRRIQEKHLSALLTREGAFIAKKSLLNDIRIQGENVRKEKQELYEKLEIWRQKHNKEMAEIVEKCREMEQAARDAANLKVDEKRQKAAEVSEESRQLKMQIGKQREEEIQRKIRLIQEIKTIQSLRLLPLRDFDPTESSGLGLLCEMSLVELKERLFWMKLKLKEELENRKTVIRRRRETQKNLIQDTQKALEEYKAKNCSSSRRGFSATKMAEPSSVIDSPEIQLLRKKLEERRAARLRK